MRPQGPKARLLLAPETHIAMFALLLNYPWEFLQVPFFAHMPTLQHWVAVLFCTRAALGDVVIALGAYWAVAALRRNRHWICRPDRSAVLLFVAAGILVTVGLEWHATEIQDRWQYGPSMPTLPPLGTGLTPLLQWLVLPPLIVWFARRQLLGQARR